MEINIGSLARFKCLDGSVYVRTKADAVDKVVFEALMKHAARELVAGGSPRVSKDLARVFTCGWSGFTMDGAPVPYSWQILEATFSPEAMAELARFVAENVDILKQ